MLHPDIQRDAAAIRDRFETGKPFRHVVVDGFLDVAAAESMLADFPRFDPAKATNETGQVGRKAVHEAVAGLSPFYRRFYEYINSRPFLERMSELTGIPDLLADETLFGGGTHENLDGQSLEAHVDFNIDERRMLHRRVNLLIYLNKEWEEAWGGAIELHSNPWYPAIDEVKAFVPLFNRALIFETNEYSWHGFPRIDLPADRKHLSRKSFSIYLYTKDRPVDEVVAPHTTFYVPPPFPAHLAPGVTLTEADVQQIHVAGQHRDGLIRMYQKLLVEKEQRVRDMMQARQYLNALGPVPDKVMGVRSWRIVMALSRLKRRVVRGPTP